MTTARPPFTRADFLPTAGFFLMGIMFSFGTIGGVLFLFHGLWILWPVILFILVFQLIFEGGAHLIGWSVRRIWRALRGLPPPLKHVPPPRPPQPWLKSYAVLLGLIAGSLWVLHGTWSNGDLGLLFGDLL